MPCAACEVQKLIGAANATCFDLNGACTGSLLALNTAQAYLAQGIYRNAIVIGACFLILLGVIDLRVPGTYIVTFIVFLCLFGGRGFDPAFISAHLAGGGLMLGAFFMATDYVTRPVTKKGQYLYGVLLGILTGVFRLFGPSAEGVSYAIILGNLLVPLIEKITMPKPFGKGGEHA